ncbi:MAG: lipopolysaccharide heptosyltransferase II [Dehalococcoidia bacterium]|nr:lipopolysaccharide heptosyltransferase II [Dehalococcoidia bacterium]
MHFRDKIISLASHCLGLLLAPLTRPPNDLPNITSILVIKPCCIGDLLMATPALGQLRRQFPTARIAVATGPWSKDILHGNPHVDEIIDSRQVGVGPLRIREYLSLVSRLKTGDFQLCLVLDRSPLVSLLPFWAGIPLRAGLDSEGRGFSLNIRVPVTEDRHEAELYLDAVRALGIEIEEPRLEFSISAAAFQWAAEKLRPQLGQLIVLQAGGGVNPGSSMPEKRWPQERFGELARLFIENGYRIVAVGDQKDKEAAAYLTGLYNRTDEPVIDLTGQTTLEQLGAVASISSLYIGNDSGPTHLAAAVGAPVVAIFGPSRPQNYAPYTKKQAVVYKGEHCTNCEFGGGLLRQCRNNLRCMKEVSVEDVWRASKEMLRQEFIQDASAGAGREE